jgi:tetratricopeptide (TPR) repeat protein
MNDRFVYISSIGFCLVVVWALFNLKERVPKVGKFVSLGLFMFLFIGYSVISFTRVPVWESALTLNESAIKVSANSARANTFMSTALFQKGLKTGNNEERLAIMQEALPYAAKSIEIYPTYYNGNLMYAGIASEIYKITNEIDPFIADFEKVMKVRPDIGYLTEFTKYLNDRGTASTKLAAMYKRVGESLIQRNKKFDAKWAAHYLNMAYTINPNDRKTNQLLGQAYQLLGDQNAANRFFNNAKQ